jgi:hypothetical protein
MRVRRTPGRDEVKAIRDAADTLLAELAREEGFVGLPEVDAATLRATCHEPADWIEVPCELPDGRRGILVFLEGGADAAKVGAVRQVLEAVGPEALPTVEVAKTPQKAAFALLKGFAVVFVAGDPTVRAVPATIRLSPETTKTERVVRGPSTSVSHTAADTLADLRGVLRTPDLKVEKYIVGTRANSKVFLLFLDGVAQPELVEMVRQKLRTYREEVLLDAAQLTPLFTTDATAMLPVTQPTERLDLLAQALIQGRVGIVVERSPTALLVPATFPELMSTTEDTYLPRYMATAARFLRYLAALFTVLLEPLYIAVTTVNHELLPTPLVMAIANSRAGVPLPVSVEVFLMALVVEVLREASVRLPNSLSQTIAIVGGLVIGQAVVQARLISAAVIVVVALTALFSFLIPNYELAVAIRYMRYLGMPLAAMFGLYGVLLFLMAILAQMARLESLGVSYLFPIAPFRSPFWERVLRYRWPKSWWRRRRPVFS